jgi:hypothetical protein
MQTILGLLLAAGAFAVVFICFEVMAECCGEDSLPSAIFLSVTALWSLWCFWPTSDGKKASKDILLSCRRLAPARLRVIYFRCRRASSSRPVP